MHGHWSPLEEAQYAVAHEHPGGAVALAAAAGMNPGTLSNKVNPTQDTHHLTVAEAIRLQNVARDHRILHAEARAQGHVAIPVRDWRGVSDTELLDALAGYVAEVGRTAHELSRALADGIVTRAELQDLEGEAYRDMGAVLELLARVRGMVRE